ncbi:hypothetical protein Elgi_42580 [Paenibacillus elgii]|nr:hypothetical protein Elgi_42580 [Paenibacillus elgii]
MTPSLTQLEEKLQEKPKDKPLKKAMPTFRNDYLEQNKIRAVVKYSTYHREKSKAWQKDISKIENWTYNTKQDTWTCAAGQILSFRRVSKEKTESGYEIEHRHYRSTSCEGCPLKPRCTKA